MKYRSRTDIISTILQTANRGATKTRIMYGAYLSYAQVKEYLAFLLEKGLLKYESGTALYKLTDRGVDFLRASEEMEQAISTEQNETVARPTATETPRS